MSTKAGRNIERPTSNVQRSTQRPKGKSLSQAEHIAKIHEATVVQYIVPCERCQFTQEISNDGESRDNFVSRCFEEGWRILGRIPICPSCAESEAITVL